MNKLNNSLGYQYSKEIKKIPPQFNPKIFTGEESIETNRGLGNNSSIFDLINSCKIDLSENLDPPPVAMQIVQKENSVTLFTKGNFSIVTGAAKSRKTFLISMLLATAIKGILQGLFTCPTKGVNLLFDTEQSRYKVHQISKRICSLTQGSATCENLQIYSLRTLDPFERINLIEAVLEKTSNVNFVVIDGIIDLDIDPILQAEQAQRIVAKLMWWTEIYKIHIVCVLHYNKSVATLLGHLGSFCHRKAEAIISVTKSRDDESVSLVEPVDCREKEFLPFAFSIDSDALPYILEDYSFNTRSKEKKKEVEAKQKAIVPGDFKQQVHIDILTIVFKIQKEQGYNDLWRNIKNAIPQITGDSIGDNKAKDFFTYYLSKESIIKVNLPKKKAVYTQAGQRGIDFK